MAEKITAPGKGPAPNEGADDLAVLYPHRTIMVADREITLREYSFVESLRLRPLTAPLLADLQELMRGDLPTNEQIQDVLSAHGERIIELMAASADVSVDWVRSLNQEEGEHLLDYWWGVCGPFFMRSAMKALRRERLLEFAQEEKNRRDGQTSMPDSSALDTDRKTSPATH